MSPIDDELRAALHGRADVLAPSPDPLAGIERRAERLRRHRIGAAVAGSALAVAAVAAAVPALQSVRSTTQPEAPMVASAEPTLAPRPTSYALDPEDPWALRGTPVDESTRATIQGEYATRTGGSEVLVTPLFAQVYEPSAQLEVVFLAEVDGAYRWGVAQSSESGPEFLWDEPLPDPARALAAALPGDEVARLLVLASPDAVSIDYGSDDGSGSSAMAELARGVAVVALDSDPATDYYEVSWPEGTVIDEAPDLPPAERPIQDEGPVDEGETPTVDAAGYPFDPADPWEFRGLEEMQGNLAIDDERLFLAGQPGRRGISWTTRPLYYGSSDAGMDYLFVLHTAQGQLPVVTTTWQVGDRKAEQTEQGVEPGQQLIQALVPTDLGDDSVLLVALASPQAGGIVLTQPGHNRPDGIGDPGVGLWLLDKGKRDGTIRLSTEGDGVEYYAEPVDVGPGAY